MEIQNSLISIIVPVYNVEKYLRECLDSILAQTHKNFELVLVDDGSKDSSGDICEEYAAKDSRIVLIHQENRGLSGARNTGLAASKGEYIIFIDSDDTITVDYLEKKYIAIKETNADFVFSDMTSTKLAGSESLPKIDTLLDKGAAERWLTDLSSREYVLMVIACNKLYRATLIKDIRFIEGRLHEDEFFINQILQRMSQAVFIPDNGYIYRDNEEGITGAGNATDIRHLDVIDAYAERIRYAVAEDEFWFANKTLSNALYKTYHLYKTNPGMSDKAKSKLLELCNEFRHVLTFKQRLKYFVLIHI